MRIAIDIRRAGDFGIGTYIRNIVNQLARLDLSTHYVLIGRKELREEFDRLPENFEWLDYPAEPGSLRTHLHLPFVLQRRRIDILHVPWLYAPTVLPCRLVMTVHDLTDYVFPPPAPPVGRALRPYMARRALLRARRVVAVSHSTKRDLARVFGIPDAKVAVIYNAVDERLTREPFPADAERVIERHAVHHPYVLYAGNIKPQKNLPRLIEAFAVAKAELRDHAEFAPLKLLVIGDELTKHPDLRRAVVRTRVEKDVRFLGFVPHPVLRVFYARARAFLFPSLYEGFGLPPLEAMAHGTPVLVSNIPSLSEVFGHAAVTVSPENVFEIARGIVQVLTDEGLRQELVRRGHDLVARYSWQRAAEQIRGVYESAANGRSPAT